MGAPLALVVESRADVAAVQAGDYSAAMAVALGGGAPAAAAPAAAAAATAAAPAAAAPAAADVAASISALDSAAVFPAARHLMAQHGLNPAPLAGRGSGKGGRITKGDVLVALGHLDRAALGGGAAAAAAAAPAAAAATAAAVAKPAAAAAVSAAPGAAAAAKPAAAVSFAVPPRDGGSYSDVKPSTVRKVIAARLTESKAGIPHQYALMDCTLDALMALRATLAAAGVKVSVNDMIIKAAAKALRDVPEANCFYDAKGCVRGRSGWARGSGRGGWWTCALSPLERRMFVSTTSHRRPQPDPRLPPVQRLRAGQLGRGHLRSGGHRRRPAHAHRQGRRRAGAGGHRGQGQGPGGACAQRCVCAAGSGHERTPTCPHCPLRLTAGSGHCLLQEADAPPPLRRAGKLKPEEFQGGSFTISNLGMFGIDDFTAVINPPQACILAVGKGAQRVVLPPISSPDDVDPAAPMPTPSLATVMSVQLSSDARVVDPHVAGQFLQAFRHYIQNPALLVV